MSSSTMKLRGVGLMSCHCWAWIRKKLGWTSLFVIFFYFYIIFFVIVFYYSFFHSLFLYPFFFFLTFPSFFSLFSFLSLLCFLFTEIIICINFSPERTLKEMCRCSLCSVEAEILRLKHGIGALHSFSVTTSIVFQRF